MDQRTILIVGANGQLGTALKEKYSDAIALDSDGLDITDAEAVRTHDWSGVKVILNAAAYTNVDSAETSEGRILAWKVNAVGVRNLAEAAARHDITICHISSEYVFDGTKTPHTEDEAFSPLGVYAQTKAAGDIAVSLAPKHYILRTSWVIGEGKNFVRSILSLGSRDISPSVVADQFGRLTFTVELVRAIDHLITTQPDFGVYNISNGGDNVSWADVARQIYEDAGFTAAGLSVGDTTAEEYFAGKVSAPRPTQSALDLTKIETTGFTPRDWREDLASYIANELAKEQQV